MDDKCKINHDELENIILKYICMKKLVCYDDIFSNSASARHEDSIWADLCKLMIGSYDFVTSWRIQCIWNRNTNKIKSKIKMKFDN